QMSLHSPSSAMYRNHYACWPSLLRLLPAGSNSQVINQNLVSELQRAALTPTGHMVVPPQRSVIGTSPGSAPGPVERRRWSVATLSRNRRVYFGLTRSDLASERSRTSRPLPPSVRSR